MFSSYTVSHGSVISGAQTSIVPPLLSKSANKYRIQHANASTQLCEAKWRENMRPRFTLSQWNLKAWQTVFFFLFFFFCRGMTLPSVLTQECIESIFSSLHQKGRRCQVVQQSQRFSEKQQQGEWTINSVIPLQTKTVSYSREKEGITGE